MAKRRRKSSRKNKDSPLWQWILVALVAFGLYKGVDYYLQRRVAPPKPSTPATSKQKKVPELSQKPGPIPEWTFESVEKFLPEQAFPDNFQPTTVVEGKGALLAFAKQLPGKDPGPKGLTNTQPGIRYIHWDGKKYQTKDLDFEKLEASLADLPISKLEGLPHISKQPFREGETFIYPTRIFLQGDDREVMAYVKVQGDDSQWALLQNPSGKRMPAAFVLGTTAQNSRLVRHRKYGGRNYLILENGMMDEMKAYQGYQWNIQAYYWDGNQYVYDSEYSKKLTEAKKKSS